MIYGIYAERRGTIQPQKTRRSTTGVPILPVYWGIYTYFRTHKYTNSLKSNFPKTTLYFQAGAENEARLAQTTPVKSYRLDAGFWFMCKGQTQTQNAGCIFALSSIAFLFPLRSRSLSDGKYQPRFA